MEYDRKTALFSLPTLKRGKKLVNIKQDYISTYVHGVREKKSPILTSYSATKQYV